MKTAKQSVLDEVVRANEGAENEVAEGDGDEGDANESGESESDGDEGSCEDACEQCDGSCEESDEVNQPDHYLMGKVQCVDAIESAVVGLVGIEAFLAGNVMKYLWRHEWKDGSKDLAKCHWYLCALMEARATREAEDDSAAGDDDSEAPDEVDANDDSEVGEDVDDGDESDEPKSKPGTKHHE
jgi:hypothetical protein